MDIFLPIAHVDISIWLILAFGGIIGLLSSALGVGGGFLLTPLLIFSGVPPIVSAATSATQIVGTSAAGSYSHLRMGNVDVKMAIPGLLGSWLGAAVGVWLARILERGGHFGTMVSFVYIVVLTTVAVSMFWESVNALRRGSGGGKGASTPAAPGLAARLPWQMDFPTSGVRHSVLLPFGLGAVIGLLPAIGMGGGFVLVPVMIYVLKMPTKVAMGTSLFQLVFTTLLVSILQAGLNHAVDPYLALLLILGSIFGVQIGTRLSAMLPAEQLRLLLAVVLIGVSVKLLFGLLMMPHFPVSMVAGVQ